MMIIRLFRIAANAASMMSLVGLVLSACVPAQQYNALENDYNQLNQQLSGEISQQQVHITRTTFRSAPSCVRRGSTATSNSR
jgi:hypothetical protein